MRLRAPLFVLLAASVAWLGCEERTDSTTPDLTGPSFAAGRPPADCDVKDLPVGDYFEKTEAREVSALLKNLSAACVDGLQADALNFGFQVLARVEAGRPNASDFEAGGKIVAGVWTTMQYNGGDLRACEECGTAVVVDSLVAEALEFGAFAVRDTGSAPVVSPGAYPYIWGIEPPDDSTWSAIVPVGQVLVYGYPLGLGALGDPSLTTGYDWSVVPWYADPTTGTVPLLVGTCVPSTGSNVGLVSHEPTGGSPTLLPRGPSPTYCTVQESLGSRLVEFASWAVPFWPEPLNAAAMVGVSGSGKAREFSPFHQYDVAPYAAVTFSPSTPPDGTVTSEVCVTNPCTTVTWTTEGLSPIASSVTLRFATEANSSSWAEVYMCVAPVYADGSYGPASCGLEPREVTCDGRDTASSRCVGLAVTSFISDKTGSHRICVNDVDVEGEEDSGLALTACTPTFNIKP